MIIIKEKELGWKNIDRVNDGTRVLVTRHPIQWNYDKYKIDEWIKELGPTEDLLKRYKNDVIPYEQFKSEYIFQIKNNPESREAFEKLCNRIIINQKKGQTTIIITLLCLRRDGPNCHRYILKSLLDERISPD